jgi:L-lactate dehydrogenase complex protein LldG
MCAPPNDRRLHHEYHRPELQSGHYTCFHTGPPATADIEGVLIHSAQGVRSPSVLPTVRVGATTPEQISSNA